MNGYYKSCAVPKPADKKKKKLANGYKDKPNRYCIECGTAYAERHEIFGGANRQHSIEDRLQIDLCPSCHHRWHEATDASSAHWRAIWRQRAQRCFERRLMDAGAKPKRARKMFTDRYGINVLEEEPKEEEDVLRRRLSGRT